MKNALILHGTSANPHANWFDWLKEKLEATGYAVWVPQLPDADYPDMQKYRQFIFESELEFNNKTLLIGHSSGAVAALSLLEALPDGVQIDTAVMVGVYRPELNSYSTGESIDTAKIRSKAKRFIFVHSDNDPYCPIEQAKYYADALDAEFVCLPDNDHFSYELNPKHRELPELGRILGL